MATFQSSDGLNIYYEDTGEGLPILCLPGLTRTTTDFDDVTPHLAGNRLIKMVAYYNDWVSIHWEE